MILKASERGGARQLARHLLNTNDNEHVEIHTIDGFVGDGLPQALNEIHGVSRGTRCKNYLFSLSLNPPKGEDAPVQVFDQAISRIEDELNLTGQPKVVVFHEKNGRRHAHVVWSKIDTEAMKAIHLSYFKNKLRDISKELYLENNWQLPAGHINRENRNPLNFTTKEWYQAKRLDENPKQIKRTLQECWSISRIKDDFLQALERNGYYLAKGDRRGYVAVDWRGEVFSLPRMLNVKKTELAAKLGPEQELPSVSQTKDQLDKQLAANLKAHLTKLDRLHSKRFSHIQRARQDMVARHRVNRDNLTAQQEERWAHEHKARRQRFKRGLGGLWERMTGKHTAMAKQNEVEAYQCLKRDQKEKDQLILSQLSERESLQRDLDQARENREYDEKRLKEAIFSKSGDALTLQVEEIFRNHSIQNESVITPVLNI